MCLVLHRPENKEISAHVYWRKTRPGHTFQACFRSNTQAQSQGFPPFSWFKKNNNNNKGGREATISPSLGWGRTWMCGENSCLYSAGNISWLRFWGEVSSKVVRLWGELGKGGNPSGPFTLELISFFPPKNNGCAFSQALWVRKSLFLLMSCFLDRRKISFSPIYFLHFVIHITVLEVHRVRVHWRTSCGVVFVPEDATVLNIFF